MLAKAMTERRRLLRINPEQSVAASVTAADDDDDWDVGEWADC